MHRVSTTYQKTNSTMTRFNNKYKVETSRLKSWDYKSYAPYFITICTVNGEHFFGGIQNDEMVLNDVSIIVEKEWERTPSIRPDMNLTLKEFVVMPNHFHAVICIGENEFNSVVTCDGPNKFGPQSKNLASVIRGFKSSVTKQTKKSIPP
jgi:hypothetical protein